MDRRKQALVDAGLADRAMVEAASDLGDLLRSAGVTEAAYLIAISSASDLPPHDFSSEPGLCLGAVEVSLLDEFRAVPVEGRDGIVTLAVSDPFDEPGIEELRRRVERPVELRVAWPPAVDLVLAVLRSAEAVKPEPLSDLNELLLEDHESSPLSTELEGCEDTVSEWPPVPSLRGLSRAELCEQLAHALDDAQASEEDSPVVAFTWRLLVTGWRLRARALVLEPSEGRSRIRVLAGPSDAWVQPEGWSVTDLVLRSITARLKILGGLDLTERRRPQNGSFRVRLEDEQLRVAISCLPSAHGEEVCLRFADACAEPVPLGALGLPKSIRARLDDVLSSQPAGLVLVAGPGRSGVSTTLRVLSEKFTEANRKLVTIQPSSVAAAIPGATRVETCEAIGHAPELAVRSALRHLPTALCVEATLSVDLAELVTQAAESGVHVLFGLSALSSADAVARLLHLSVDPERLAAVLGAAVSQRAVRLLCAECKRSADAGSEGFTATGCPACLHSGCGGRTAVFEATSVAPEEMSRFGDLDWLEVRRREGLAALRGAALALAREGKTSFREARLQTHAAAFDGGGT